MLRGRLWIPLFAAAVALDPGEVAASPIARTVSVGGGRIDLTIEEGGPSQASPADVERWVRRGAEAVTAFYGRFPVARVRLVVTWIEGRRIHGMAFGSHRVRMRLGREATRDQLERDWTLTHELFHLGFPDLAPRHLWMQEGMATYFEPIARARVGQMPAAELWRELFDGLPKGMPRAGEGGLDDTPSWGATYWGGALFWFLADLEIRRQTQDRRSADDVLRAVLAAGGDGSRLWTVAQILKVAERATGTPAVASVYDRVARRRFAVDLDDLAARLGVAGGRLDDRAPLAAIRRSITARSAARCREARSGERPPPPGANRATPCPASPPPYARPGTPGR